MPIRATTRIYRDRPGHPGTRELAYKVGDLVSDEDAIALGLVDKTEPKAKPESKRGPRKKPER